ncbi:hypothetical protein WS91_20710 [Burkholderia sp. MSMB1498]|nr:hypothetical protein WS91_20710 [Burkholderia sp. MSMB1498]
MGTARVARTRGDRSAASVDAHSACRRAHDGAPHDRFRMNARPSRKRRAMPRRVPDRFGRRSTQGHFEIAHRKNRRAHIP